jgi:multidrug resistance efflux pump
MGYGQVVRGHVGSIARGINVPNAQPDQAGLASVNPIFTWVRLAQRVPVRIAIDQTPEGVRLVAGMTATVEIDPPTEVRLERFTTGLNRMGYANRAVSDSRWRPAKESG